jgi:hypothetical protein
MYSLYNTPVELDTRLATAPQPAFHYNTLLASLAIISSLPLSPFSITLLDHSLTDFMALGFIAWDPTP